MGGRGGGALGGYRGQARTRTGKLTSEREFCSGESIATVLLRGTLSGLRPGAAPRSQPIASCARRFRGDRPWLETRSRGGRART
jgi:hypothetical protein